MSEIKPVYQVRVRFNLWEDQTKEQYEDSKFGDGVPRILYPAAAYEALQKENAELKEAAKYAEHIDATPANQRETMLYDTLKERDTLKAESAAQAKRIAVLEKQISSQMNFGEPIFIDLSDGSVIGEDTGRVVAKFSHWNEAESFCEAANFKYSASKNRE